MLRDDRGRLLLGLRAPHIYSGDHWGLVEGKAEAGEDAVSAMLREAHEEIGVRLDAADLTPAAVVHYRGEVGQIRVGFGFTALHDPRRHGAVVNAEPHKCQELRWCAPDRLPAPLGRYTAAVLAAAGAPERFTVAGWTAR